MRLICLWLALALVAGSAAAGEGDGPLLREAIESLLSEGLEVIYSSDLVGEDVRIAAHPTDIDGLQSMLRPLGLELEHVRDDTWLVRRMVPVFVEVEGMVTDILGERLDDVSVRVGDQAVRSDSSGMFTVRVVEGEHNGTASAIGYVTRSFAFAAPRTVEAPLAVVLAPVPALENVVVSVSRYELGADRTVSSQLLLRQDFEDAPTLGDDPVRAVNSLPGSAGIGFSSRPRVRGGNQDEILVMLDDVELVEPFHLKDFQNLFSTLNPGTIRSIEFYTGGFPARYGNRMSAVLDIDTQPVEQDRGGELSLTTFSTSLMAYGRSGRTDAIVAARRGNLDVITNVVNPEVGDPSYADAILRIGKDFPTGARVEGTVLHYSDRVTLNVDDVAAASHILNNYAWVKLETRLGAGVDTTVLLSHGDIRHRRRGVATDEEKLNGTVTDRRAFEVTTLKQLFDWEISDALFVEGGYYLAKNRGAYDYEAEAERGVLTELLGFETELAYGAHHRPDGAAAGMYASMIVDVNDRWTLQPGVRLDYQGYLGSSSDRQFSFRLGVLYEPADLTKVRFAVGRFHQPQAIHELQVADGESRFYPSQRSDHVILGVERASHGRTLVKLEIFFKRSTAMKPRFENLFNPFVTMPEIARDRIRIDADKARAGGIEISVANDRKAPLHWWFNYAAAKVEDYQRGRWVPRRWDQRHTGNGGLTYRSGGLVASAIATWHSGWAATLLPPTVPIDGGFDIGAVRNTDRFRSYSSLNLRVSYEWALKRSALSAFLELSNVFNRTNDGGIDYDVEEDEDEALYVLEEIDVKPVFPLATSVGLIWRF